MSDPAQSQQRAGGARTAAGLARAATAPACCAVVLLVLLATWVAGGGGGTVRTVRLSVTMAAVPAPAAGAAGPAPVYLTVRNLTGETDDLLSATSPDAARVVLTRAVATDPHAIGGLPVPARHSLSLSPFGADLVLIGPRLPAAGHVVLLRLRFRIAGTVTVTAIVTPPGTP